MAKKVAQASKFTSEKGKSKISDALRQAVKDLGGDDDDLDLIAGVDSDEEEDDPASVKGKGKATDEKSLKKALGDFMKGLDFAAVSTEVPTQQQESDEEDEDDDNEEEEEVDDKEEEEEEDEGEEENNEEDYEQDEEQDEQSDGNSSEVGEDAESEEASSEDEEEESEQFEKPATIVKQPKAIPVESKVVPSEAEPKSGSTIQRDINATSGTIVPAAPVWTSLLPELSSPSQPLKPIPASKLATLKNRGQNMLDNLPPLARASSSSDAAFIAQILQSGTHQDKLSALVLIVRESPIHAVKELSRLRAMTGSKEDGTTGGGGNKDQRVAVVKALADWWVTGGGKEQGKLRYFADQPLLAHPEVTDRHLLVFAFEDFLKRFFFSILQVLEVLSHDTLPFVRTQVLHIIFQLLSGNAEQEQNLLRLGVNKLGDTDRSVASKTSHHILQLLSVHPAMKAVVAREVSALILKPTTTQPAASTSHTRFDDDKASEVKAEPVNHARYYGLITLNQVTLTKKDQEVAGRMVEVYFEVFREVLGDGLKDQEEEVEGAELEQSKIEKAAGKVERWRGRRKGAKPKNGRKTALESEELVDTGEAKLVAAVLTGINRALPFAKLDEAMFNKYMDTLFKITHAGTFNTSIQALQLIYQVCQSRQAVSDRFYRTLYDSLFDARLVTSSKQAMYLNLLFKALKADTSLSRVMAFVKRLLQMLGLHQPPFISGALYLLGELFSSTPGLKRMLIEPEDDGEEHFVDVPEGSSTQHAPTAAASSSKAYDGRKREPQFANADSSCLWELVPLLDHFHPSVSLQAQQLLLSQPLTGSSDISLNTLVAFLDRFVYRNPKKTLQPKGASIMQPAAASDRTGTIVRSKGARAADESFVNSEAFWRKKVEQVPVDQLFFHKFFSSKLAQKESSRKKSKRQDDSDEDESDAELPGSVASIEGSEVDDDEGEGDEEEEDSDAEEAEIWKVMKATMPDAGDDLGLSDDESDEVDLDMSEIDDLDEEVDDDEEEDEEDEDEEEDKEEEDEDEDEVDVDVEEEDVESDELSAPTKSKTKGKRAPSVDSDDSFPSVEEEDDEDLIPLDDIADIPLDASEEEEEEETKKRKHNAAERKERKKKRREMPVFGSYEDYARLIEEAGNDGTD
ncbi:CBF/Mak21 family-domain-containing protein [Naematelia encephala]|uniref:CBF/Mak21 family-domain-containing protein n=1 Tax=Naematelia encephala TaxID=71784 RepID=A0A1Y2BIP3_9TREE|nr:CBF/Mak21 family-domain-containing protein [Naematelia encephala]